MDFDADIRQQILSRLPRSPEFDTDLAGMKVRDLLVVYANWLSRLVSPQARRVHQSRALHANPLTADSRYAPGLAQIISRITNGEDVTPHLSKRTRKGYQPARAPQRTLRRRQDLDLILNDWGIHHLHLSTEVDTDGFFVKRDGPLLFAAFRPNDAYLIDIVDHESWAREDLLRVIVDEWLDAGIVCKVEGIRGPSISESDRLNLRGAGVGGTVIEIDGRSYSPTAMISSAGTTFNAVRSADKLLSDLTWFQDQIANSADFIPQSLVTAGVTPPQTADLHFEFFESGYGVIERNTGCRLILSKSPE